MRAKNSAVISLEKYFRLVDSISSRPWKNYKRKIFIYFSGSDDRILIYFYGSGDKELADKQQPHVESGLERVDEGKLPLQKDNKTDVRTNDEIH